MKLPETSTLLLEQRGSTLFVTLNRPKVRNAMSLEMVDELLAVFREIHTDRATRSVVIRGSGGTFCAGGDIRDMVSARSRAGKGGDDPFYALNRRFGELLSVVNEAPQVVIVLLEGAVLGGGFGLACTSDIAISLTSTRFGLPETGLGIPPAQIAPFVVGRIGLTQARRLALTGARFDGSEARQLGLIHFCCEDETAMLERLNEVLEQVQRCAPHANVLTKELMLYVGRMELSSLLDEGAAAFSQSVQGQEGQEGGMAFIQKRPPSWAVTDEEEQVS